MAENEFKAELGIGQSNLHHELFDPTYTPSQKEIEITEELRRQGMSAFDHATQYVSQLYNNLHTIEDRGFLTESMFVNVYLKYLLGIDETPGYGYTPQHWAEIQRHPNRKVDIVSDNTHEYLFTVPALFPTEVFDTRVDLESSYLSNKGIEIVRDAQVFAGRAEQTLREEIIEHVPVFNKDSYNKYLDEWIVIIKRYKDFLGMDLGEVEDSLKESTKKKVNSISDLIVDDDDWD